MARRTRFMTRGGFRPATDWGHVTLGGVLTAGVEGTDCDVFDLTAAMDPSPNDEPETVMRVHGTWMAWVTSTPGDAVGFRNVGIGIGVESLNAIAAGGTPCPVTDGYWDGWLLHQQALVHSLPVQVGGAIPRHGFDSAVWILDSQAMRRLEDNSLFLAIEFQTDSGAADIVNYWAQFRVLFKPSSKR